MSKDKEEKFSGVKEFLPEKKVKKQETVMIMFRENRKFDLHVGRNMITFKGRENKKIPKNWLKHPDFLQQSKKFIVKGV